MSTCPFCDHAPSSHWLESPSALALWDGFPVSDGHTLVVPRSHVASLSDLPAAEQAAVWEFVARGRAELRDANRALGCDFFEGIVMKRAESAYPMQLRSATEECRGWGKHRFLI